MLDENHSFAEIQVRTNRSGGSMFHAVRCIYGSLTPIVIVGIASSGSL